MTSQQVRVTMPRNVPMWRPFDALTQAEYNALAASNAFDPNILYAITPARVMLGGREVWPGPWPGGIEHVTTNAFSGAGTTVAIPQTTPGNLLVVIRHGAANGTLGGNGNAGTYLTGVTDSAGQAWTNATPGLVGNAGGQGVQVQCFYMENSAAINSVTFQGGGTTPSYVRIFELSGMATDAFDSAFAGGAGWVGQATLFVTPSFRSVVFAAIGVTPDEVSSRPESPWTNFEDFTLPMTGAGSDPKLNLCAMRVVDGGQVASASWNFPTNRHYGSMLAVFRTAATEPYVPEPF